ncbi:MAG TPA: hypothetical protein VGD49_09240 [Longimicrobiales bacterium]
MTRWLSCALVVAIALVVHIDWHIGRPVHTGHALGWSLHWVIAIPTFALMTQSILARAGWKTLAFVILQGLLVGQIVEPLGEVLIYRLTWSEVMPFDRWRIFCEFAIAGIATSCVTLALQFRRQARSGT